MAKHLECDRCGRRYDDEETMMEAEKGTDSWNKMCRDDGVEPRGIAPCPDLGCRGELVLKE